MKLVWMAAGIVLATTSAAYAKDNDKDSKEEKVICKTEKVTGSRTKTKRICMTEQEWAQLAAETRKDVDDLSRNRQLGGETGTGGPGGGR